MNCTNGTVSENDNKIQSEDKVMPNSGEEIVNDILAVSGTSFTCDGTSCDMRNNTESRCRFRDYLENYTTSNADIGNICVENSSDISFGNKTYFNGPVVIKQFVANDAEQKPDPYQTSKG